jgi:transposase
MHHRRVLDGIFWIARTGAPWRDLPEQLGNWNSVWRQFRRWSASALWDVLLQALADTGGGAETLQMIDSTIIRAPHLCSRRKRGDSEASSWPLARWLLDQNPRPG